MPKTNFDIAVIGAGIIGAACAERLAREGFATLVIDAGDIAGGTTATGMGHIVVMDDSDAQFALTDLSQKIWHTLAEQLPASSEYEHCGTIWVAADDEEMREVRRKKDFYDGRGPETEILDEKNLILAEPNLREGLAGGLLVKSDGVVYQPAATRFLIEQAKSCGAEILTNCRAIEITDAGVKLADGRFIGAGKTIVSAGIWSNDLIEGLKIRRKKGHLVITERYPNFVRHQLVELGYLKSAHASEADSVAFNVQPRFTGQVLLGSSRQFDVADKDIDYNILRQMTRRAFEYLPNLKNLLAVRVWTGFRPATADNLPLIGRHPRFENVFLATGHEGLGITTALGTAEILTDEIMARPSKIDRKPFAPDRFFA